MTALIDNPAVLDPRAALTPAQQDALCTIGYFRHARLSHGIWHIGKKRFAAKTVESLQRLKLTTRALSGPLALTTAGQIAADKLKGTLQ